MSKSRKKGWIIAGMILIVLVGISSYAFIKSEARNNQLAHLEGVLECYEGVYYVNATELNLGNKSTLIGDFDQDEIEGSIEAELQNLIGKEVIISGYRDSDPDDYYELYVSEINGIIYHNSKLIKKKQKWQW